MTIPKCHSAQYRYRELSLHPTPLVSKCWNFWQRILCYWKAVDTTFGCYLEDTIFIGFRDDNTTSLLYEYLIDQINDMIVSTPLSVPSTIFCHATTVSHFSRGPQSSPFPSVSAKQIHQSRQRARRRAFHKIERHERMVGRHFSILDVVSFSTRLVLSDFRSLTRRSICPRLQ